METAQAAVVGPGKAGTALALALAGILDVIGAAGGGEVARQRFARATGVRLWEDTAALVRAADWVFLTVPDRAIAAVAADLARAGAFRPGQVVVHLSGADGAELLASARAGGAQALALHPMQSFADPSRGRALFQGIVCTLEGDETAVAQGETLVRRLGATPWRVRAADKPVIHAACVLAANDLVALLAHAAALLASVHPEGGVDEALRALLPLARGALNAVEALGVPGALTGPVERGDATTVRRHLAALGERGVLYRAFLPVLYDVATEKGSLAPASRAALAQLLTEVVPGWRGA
jgi:predicted short-subunit dehydrogenase-like oxidoreductase (DUF2520 family)